ncbi:MAG: carboxypeptidase-like regulatory domain-containing protein, partial [Thermoanaerobaculia bacterium]
MRSGSRLLMVAAICLLATWAAFAQTTATLSGTVTTDGTPLPGATVTITSPNMQGSRTTTTGDAGGYSFNGLPPGVYAVKIELSGMTTVTKSVSIGVGQAGRADADLKVSAVAEAITVTATAP